MQDIGFLDGGAIAAPIAGSVYHTVLNTLIFLGYCGMPMSDSRDLADGDYGNPDGLISMFEHSLNHCL